MKLDRIISIATLAALIVAIVLLVKRNGPVTQSPQAPAASSSQSTGAPSPNSQSPGQTTDKPEPAVRQVQTQPMQAAGATATQPSKTSPAAQTAKTGAGVSSDAVSAAISKLLGASGTGLTPDTNIGEGAPNIKDQRVTYDGDTVHGQFLTEIGGKDVWITISGHMGQKDGYATFDPTEFKVGDMEVPVSLVNPALQQKLAEERDRLKLSEPAK